MTARSLGAWSTATLICLVARFQHALAWTCYANAGPPRQVPIRKTATEEPVHPGGSLYFPGHKDNCCDRPGIGCCPRGANPEACDKPEGVIYPLSLGSAASHSAALKPTSTNPSPTRTGRLTSIPSVARRAI